MADEGPDRTHGGTERLPRGPGRQPPLTPAPARRRAVPAHRRTDVGGPGGRRRAVRLRPGGRRRHATGRGRELAPDTDCEGIATEGAAVMDGLQLQWALAPGTYDMPGRLRTYLDRLLRSLTTDGSGLPETV
ncbi:TetR family transcriptional regulator C-terminal domain-containing protein [Streptomyces sp. NPDC049954]|uniref:TetR family transcriptional regulator C-terminal domain-containing protein n=1 Tax=Streptomyces sp. NPDC049954 TaxID=3155779 RepID=UPI00341EBA4E